MAKSVSRGKLGKRKTGAEGWVNFSTGNLERTKGGTLRDLKDVVALKKWGGNKKEMIRRGWRGSIVLSGDEDLPQGRERFKRELRSAGGRKRSN